MFLPTKSVGNKKRKKVPLSQHFTTGGEIQFFVLDTVGTKHLFFHCNANFSIYAATDETGDVVERIQYDVFGRPDFQNPNGKSLDRDKSIVDNPYLFQGRRWDGESKLFYYRNRYYDPGKGRFVSRDPMGIWFDVLQFGNGYGSFGLSPLTKVDYLGYKVVSEAVKNCFNKFLLKKTKKLKRKIAQMLRYISGATPAYIHNKQIFGDLALKILRGDDVTYEYNDKDFDADRIDEETEHMGPDKTGHFTIGHVVTYNPFGENIKLSRYYEVYIKVDCPECIPKKMRNDKYKQCGSCIISKSGLMFSFYHEVSHIYSHIYNKPKGERPQNKRAQKTIETIRD